MTQTPGPTVQKALAQIKERTTPEVTTYKKPSRRKISPSTLKRWQTWLNFDSCQDPELAKVLRASATFNEDMCLHSTPYWLTLLGSSGTGKTHLAKGAWKCWRNKAGWKEHRCGARIPRDGYYWDWGRFINELRDRHYGVFEDACRAPFLVLDDIGAGHSTSSFAIDKLYEVLNARLGKWTVITANQKLETISEWDQRIASRLIRNGNQCIEVVTDDYATRDL